MAEFNAVCVDGEFEQYGTISGEQIRCTGTLVNATRNADGMSLTQQEIADLSTAVLGFFAVCFVVRFLTKFIVGTNPGRGG